jgi:hypothetical protein
MGRDKLVGMVHQTKTEEKETRTVEVIRRITQFKGAIWGIWKGLL